VHEGFEIPGLSKIINAFKAVGTFFGGASTDGSLANRFHKTGDGIAAMGPAIKNGMEKLGDELKTGITDLGPAFNHGFNKMGEELNKDINKIGGAIVDESTQLNANLTIVTDDVTQFFVDSKFLFEYINDFFTNYISAYLTCGLNKILNFKTCILYYMLDTTGQILYLPIRLFIFVLKTAFCIDLQPTADNVWNAIDCIDEFMQNNFTNHNSLIHYPPSIISMCYVCQDKQGNLLGDPPPFPKQIFIDDLNQIKSDLIKVPDGLYQPFVKMGSAFKHMGPDFNDGFVLMGKELKTAGDEIKNAFPDGFGEMQSSVIEAGNTIKDAWTNWSQYNV